MHAQRNALSVRLELQADCYAGVWGFYAAKRNLLDPGDVEEGLRAAAAVGDDSITKGRAATPDAFTHGTAQQRSRWFKQGMTTGDPRTCDTFAPAISDGYSATPAAFVGLAISPAPWRRLAASPPSAWKRTRRTTRSYSLSTAIVTSSPFCV